MDASRQAQALVDELGAALGIEGLAFDAEGSLALQLDGELMVTLGIEEATGSLVLFAPVLGSEGPKPPSFLEMLLEGNFMWRGGQGATIAIEPESGAVVLQQRLALSGLAYPEFQARLEAFVNALADWTAMADREMAEGSGITAKAATAVAEQPFMPNLRA